MSNIETQPNGGGRLESVKEHLSEAGQSLKAEVRSFAGAAQERAATEAQKGVQTAGRTLGDFANAARRAGDELAGADQNPAARLVGKAADGLEQFSRSLEHKQPGELLDVIRDFGRRNPLAFLGGAVLVGLALGRFARASDHGASASRFAAETYGEATHTGLSSAIGLDPLIGAQVASPAASMAYADAVSEPTTSLGIGEGTSGMSGSDGDASGTGR